jgi:hypothetical protein
MKWLRFPVSAVVSLLLGAAACDDLAHECTLIGCADGVMFDILPEDGQWQAGSYALAVTLDDTEYACDFQLPEDLPARGSTSSIECGRLTVTIAQRVTCTETSTGDSVSHACTPLPEQYDLLLSTYDTPSESTLILARDGEELLSDARELDYEVTFPNGEDCGGGCRQTRVVLEL